LHLLELSGYLENYLWKYFDAEHSSLEHILSIVALVNEKSAQTLPVMHLLVQQRPLHAVVGGLVDRVVDFFLSTEREFVPMHGMLDLIRFFSLCVQCLELDIMRSHVLRLLSFPMWSALSETRLKHELDNHPDLSNAWRKFQSHTQSLLDGITTTTTAATVASSKRKRVTSSAADEKTDKVNTMKRDRDFFPTMLQTLFSLVDTTGEKNTDDKEYTAGIVVIEAILDFLLVVLSQVPTRRFVTSLLDDEHIILRLRRSSLLREVTNRRATVSRLVDLVAQSLRVPLDDISGTVRTRTAVLEETQTRFATLQQASFALFPDKLRDIVFSTLATLSQSQERLKESFAQLSDSELLDLGLKLGVITDKDTNSESLFSKREAVVELFFLWLLPSCDFAEDFVRDVPLFPTESLLWDEETLSVGPMLSSDPKVYPLPKLNLQFLSVHDYLTRNFELFRLESAFSIRSDIEEAVKRMNPTRSIPTSATVAPSSQLTLYGQTRGNERRSSTAALGVPPAPVVTFTGQSRMAVPIPTLTNLEVAIPLIGERVSRRVTFNLSVDISRFSGDARRDWEALKEHDVLFLIAIDKPMKEADRDTTTDFCKKYGE
jgi:intron-binding protein aquarius